MGKVIPPNVLKSQRWIEFGVQGPECALTGRLHVTGYKWLNGVGLW